MAIDLERTNRMGRPDPRVVGSDGLARLRHRKVQDACVPVTFVATRCAALDHQRRSVIGESLRQVDGVALV